MKESLNYEGSLSSLNLVPINVKTHEFQKLMLIYEKALIKAEYEIEKIQGVLKNIHNYNVIDKIENRIKSPESIINKMKKKEYDLNYKALIENIDDIAGLRIICPFKSDIQNIKKIIENKTNIEIIEIKDYVYAPKKSGYCGLHIIGQVPVDINDVTANVKIEIQIRTMAMDFWAKTEHKIKYKAQKKLSKLDSKKMIMYAKILNKIENDISKINSKYST